MNCEPHIIDFYSKEQQQKRLDKRIQMKRRLLSLPRIHQVRRFFIVWSYANREGRRSLVAETKYKPKSIFEDYRKEVAKKKKARVAKAKAGLFTQEKAERILQTGKWADK
jgi:hypothetical protein